MKEQIYALFQRQNSLTWQEIMANIIAAALIGFVIFLSYYITHRGTIYSKKFNASLVVLTTLTGTVMTVIGNNIALSLGMVGALSIVRFRTSIKDSRDTAYIFWTIILGICCGVGDYQVASIGSVVVFIVLLALGRVKNENRLLLIVRADRNLSTDIRKTIYAYFVKAPIVKAENTTQDTVELIYELDKKTYEKSTEREKKAAFEGQREEESISDKLYMLQGISYVNIVSQSDEIA